VKPPNLVPLTPLEQLGKNLIYDSTLSNLLDVHVSNIRKKLGHDFITTRRGHGYCIE